MSGERFVDVSYRGLEVGRRIKLYEIGPSTGYLEHSAPLPVGATIELATDDGLRFAARVLRVHEQVAGADHAPGMRIGVRELDAAGQAWWGALVTRADFVADAPPPRQPVAPAAESAPPAAAESASGRATTLADEDDDAAATNVMAAQRDDGEAPAHGSGGNGVPPDTRATQVMSVGEIQAIVEAAQAEDANAARGGANGEAGDEPSGEIALDSDASGEMPAAGGDGDDDSAGSASGSHPAARGKRGGGRKRSKRKTKG
jgi:hypothetical protein